jgi:ABC-type amino acid transport substrate-binding protein
MLHPTGFRMLARAHIDLLIIPEQQGDYLLAQLATELNIPICKSNLKFAGSESYIAVAKASAHGQAAIPRIIQAMKKLAADGTIRAIITSYSR